MIRQGGQTAAKLRNAARHADDGPPTKARRTHASTAAADADIAPAAKKARTNGVAGEARHGDEPPPAAASAPAARPPEAAADALAVSTARPPGSPGTATPLFALRALDDDTRLV